MYSVDLIIIIIIIFLDYKNLGKNPSFLLKKRIWNWRNNEIVYYSIGLLGVQNFNADFVKPTLQYFLLYFVYFF